MKQILSNFPSHNSCSKQRVFKRLFPIEILHDLEILSGLVTYNELRGATGAARAPKLGKSPIMAAAIFYFSKLR